MEMKNSYGSSVLKGLILVAVVAFLLGWIFSEGATYYEAIEEKWGIVLRKGEEVYSCTTPSDFHGDGDRYYVIGYHAHTDLSQVAAWEERVDERALEALQSIWRYDDFAPEETYLPQDISMPYRYFQKNKNGNGDQLVMIYAQDAQLGGRTYAQVIFVAERHS